VSNEKLLNVFEAFTKRYVSITKNQKLNVKGFPASYDFIMTIIDTYYRDKLKATRSIDKWVKSRYHDINDSIIRFESMIRTLSRVSYDRPFCYRRRRGNM
jgi:hypothetical protein